MNIYSYIYGYMSHILLEYEEIRQLKQLYCGLDIHITYNTIMNLANHISYNVIYVYEGRHTPFLQARSACSTMVCL